MKFNDDEAAACSTLLELALKEDTHSTTRRIGDVTSDAIIPSDLDGRATLIARSGGVIAGLPALDQIRSKIKPPPAMDFRPFLEDGTKVEPATPLAVIEFRMRLLLLIERIALNFLQRLSGVATLTRKYVEAVAGLPVQILDTRKTTPGWRLLEKYAVRCGGGHNHRMGLYDGFLIKDNHLAALGGGPAAIRQAVQMARQNNPSKLPVEIEVDTLEQLDAALAERPDMVLLDNMNIDQLRQAVRRRNAAAPEVKLEASGGVNLETVRGIAETGVDRVSVGALTHSAPALDIALDYLHE